MKSFKIRPLSIAVTVLLATTPMSVVSNAANHQGDLEVYKGGLPLGEIGANSGQEAETKAGNAALLMLDMSSIDGETSVGDFNQRQKKMMDTISYLMSDTSDEGLDENSFIGLGVYPSTASEDKNLSGDGLTGSINIPMGRIGPVGSAHRQKIIDYVAQLKSTPTLNPMAPAYAEAGAYMMGTTTSRLSQEPDDQSELDDYPDTRILTRQLRESNGVWEYCPPENRQLYIYENKDSNNKVKQAKARMECPELLADNTTSGWVVVNRDNVAAWNWASGLSNDGEDSASEEDIEKLNPNKNKYDLTWDTTNDEPWPVDTTNDRTKTSPVSLQLKKYHFKKDGFQHRKSTDDKADKSWGSLGAKTYYYDATGDPESILTPVLKYRKYRTRFNWQKFQREWQYCAFDKAELVNYVYSSYRFMCHEDDWHEINAGNVNQHPGAYWGVTRPAGIDGIYKNRDGENKSYVYDALLNPYTGGWAYYIDTVFYGDSYGLPPTLASFYSSSGIRNSPPEVRGFQKYTYDQPNYRICKPNADATAKNPYQSNPNNRASDGSAVVQNAAIFFITGGLPSSAALAPVNEMNKSLGLSPEKNGQEQVITDKGVLKEFADGRVGADSRYACDTSGMIDRPGGAITHWDCMGAYSRRLNSTINPTTRAIKTGVFLVSPIEGININETTCAVRGQTSILTGIDSDRKNSLRNACRLGSSTYGDGGFYATDIDTSSASIKAFAAAIKRNIEALGDDPYKFGMVPSGPITVAANTLRPGELLDHGYLPLISPNPGSGKVQWAGNLRKYKASANGYVGKNNATPFKDASNQGAASAILAGTTQDYWSIASVRSQDKAGGAFENIKLPTTANTANARKVYVSDFTQTSSSTEPGVQLKKVSPAVGVAGSFDEVKVFTPSGATTALDSKDVVIQRLLLNYMGFPLKDYVPGTTTTDDILSHLDLAQSEKVMGAVLHSTPVSFVQSATLDSATGKYTPDKEYTLFGAMDNALHLINTNSGDEVFSFFPREVLAHKGQYKGITPELSGVVGDNLPSFGVDGPWAVYTSYAKNAANKIEANKIYAYGGTRLGAKAYYGLNLTNIDKPRQLFTITNTGDFKRLGYSWGKPVITKIRWQGKPKLVAILSGGYDAEYDKTDAQRMDIDADGNSKATYTDKATMGNAIYVVDAITGEALIVASNTGTNTNDTTANNSDNAFVTKSTGTIAVLNSHMKYSIPGGVEVLDRDADELADHIYFADMDGQVFRMDINNGASKPATVVSASSTTGATNPQVRVQRVADLNGKTSSPGPRLYESLTVTIQTSPSGQRFATISVASGDRSNPLSTNMSNHVDAVYTLYDKDVAQKGLFNSKYTLAPTITAVTPNTSLGVQSLAGAALTYNASGLFAASAGNAYDNYSGWMSPLNKFGDSAASNTADTASIKAMGALPAIANKLYVSAYNPNDGLINKSDGCLPEVLGTTELHQYCLPYGVCTASSSGSGGGQYQRFRAGKGILTPSFGTEFKDGAENKMSRGLIGQNGNTNTFTALDSGAPSLKSSFTFKGALRSLAWFDMQSKGVSTSE